MPAKKKAAKAAPESKTEAVEAAPENEHAEADAQWATWHEERAANAAFVDARQQQVINERAKVKPDAEGDIDARMAALLKDHEKMGAR